MMLSCTTELGLEKAVTTVAPRCVEQYSVHQATPLPLVVVGGTAASGRNSCYHPPESLFTVFF